MDKASERFPEKAQKYRVFPSVRSFMILLSNLSLIGAGFAWSGIGFAMTCMVNSTQLQSDSDSHTVNASTTCGGGGATSKKVKDYGGTFVWNQATQSSILASVVWGGMLLLIPGGWILDKYGARKVVATCSFVLLFGMWLSPAATIYGGPWTLFLIRVVMGAFGSVLWSSMYAITYRWVPKSELGLSLAVAATGIPIGEVIAMLTSGVLCESAWGWPAIFYSQALFLTVNLFLWLVFYTDNPEKAWLISRKEIAYILSNRSTIHREKTKVPWAHILRSAPFLAAVLSHFANGFINTFVYNYLPSYFKQVLFLDAKQNGFFSCLPFLTQTVGRLLAGQLSDTLTRFMSATNVLKLFNTLCLGGPAVCLLIMGFLDCKMSVLAIFLISVSNFCLGMTTAGHGKAYGLIAPRFSSSIGGAGAIMNMLAGVVVSYAVGALIADHTVGVWHKALFMTMSVAALCGAVFIIFGSGEEQSWARHQPKNHQQIQADSTSDLNITRHGVTSTHECDSEQLVSKV